MNERFSGSIPSHVALQHNNLGQVIHTLMPLSLLLLQLLLLLLINRFSVIVTSESDCPQVFLEIHSECGSVMNYLCWNGVPLVTLPAVLEC